GQSSPARLSDLVSLAWQRRRSLGTGHATRKTDAPADPSGENPDRRENQEAGERCDGGGTEEREYGTHDRRKGAGDRRLSGSGLRAESSDERPCRAAREGVGDEWRHRHREPQPESIARARR